MELNEILTIAVKARASDIHIKSGLPPVVRIDGKLRPIPNAQRISGEAVMNMALSIMNPRQRQQFEDNYEIDLSHGVPGVCRFRVSAYRQRGSVAIVFRAISFNIPSLESLNLPPILKKIAMEERGLILV